MRSRIAMALLGASLTACATPPGPPAALPEPAPRSSPATAAASPVGITGAGSSADGLESGGVAPALGTDEATVLDAVHASNHPPRPETRGRWAGGGRGDVEVGRWGGDADRVAPIVRTTAADSATEDDVRLLAARGAKIRRCYASELRITSGLEGMLAVEVRRNSAGETFAATATGVRGGPFPTAFVACVEDAVVGATGVASGAPRAFRFSLQVSPY